VYLADIAAGAHTIKLQYRSDGTNTLLVYSDANQAVIFGAIEL